MPGSRFRTVDAKEQPDAADRCRPNAELSSGVASPPTIASDSPVTTGSGPPMSVSNVRVVATAPPPGIIAPKAQWLRITRADGKTQVARVNAIVADSGSRITPGTTRGPVLLLGFTNDPSVPHSEVVAFERVQKTNGNPTESRYYPGASHLVLFMPSTTDDATARAVTFLHQQVS
jgi:hypothetical protein